MSKINVLAVGPNGPITTKTALKDLIKSDPSAVKVIPIKPTPLLPAVRSVDGLVFGIPVTVHGNRPAFKNGDWTAEVERKFNGSIVVR
jgi:hypothetical protein